MHALTVTLLLVVGPAPQGAPALAGTYRAEWNMHRNRHSRGHRWATDRHTRATVELRLLPRGRARVLDRGERGHSSMGPLGYSGETIRWTASWRGTWRMRKGTLRLHLRLAKRQCTREKRERHHTSPRNTTTRQTCGRAHRRLTLRCRSEQVAARPGPGRRSLAKRRLPAWRCTVVGADARKAGSRTPWVFGIAHHLRVTSGWPLRYEIGARRTP